jgi:hypothetical protein
MKTHRLIVEPIQNPSELQAGSGTRDKILENLAKMAGNLDTAYQMLERAEQTGSCTEVLLNPNLVPFNVTLEVIA